MVYVLHAVNSNGWKPVSTLCSKQADLALTSCATCSGHGFGSEDGLQAFSRLLLQTSTMDLDG